MNLRLKLWCWWTNRRFSLGYHYEGIVARLVAWRKAKKQRFLLPTVHHLEPIPPESNPFHYDAYNMGTPLVRGWIVMHSGYDSEDQPFPMTYLILVNTRTGQRIRIDMSKVTKWEQFQDWRAWRPVAFGPHIVWGKVIQRKLVNGKWHFRLLPEEARAYARSLSPDQIETYIKTYCAEAPEN